MNLLTMTPSEISLFLIAITIATFAFGSYFYLKIGKIPFIQPVLISILSITALLALFNLPYENYYIATSPLHNLLGPTIVALAIPLFENLKKVKEFLIPLIFSVFLSGFCITGGALIFGKLINLPPPMQLSLSTKSITAPIALSIAEKINGSVPITVFSVFVTGITGVIITPYILRLIKITDPSITGFTLGMTSHAFGIARSVELGSEAVAFATLGMVLMGCLSAFLIPILFTFF